MRIVLAHGRAAQFEIPATAHGLWEQALRRGLERAGSSHTDIPIDYAYFGDLWRPDAHHPPPDFGFEEIAELQAGLVEAIYSSEGVIVEPQERPSPSRIADWLARWPLTGPLINQIVLRAIADVFQYLENKDLYRAVHTIVRDRINAGDDDVVLVGFSMGGIVGYQLLRDEAATLPIVGLVTCGTPIGLAPVYNRLPDAPTGPRTPFPKGLRHWLNVWCDDDVATAVRGSALSDLFPSGDDRSIRSGQTWTRQPTPLDPFAAHNPFDYLSSIAVGRAVDLLLRM